MHKIGLIPSPGVSRKHVEAVIPDIKEQLNQRERSTRMGISTTR